MKDQKHWDNPLANYDRELREGHAQAVIQDLRQLNHSEIPLAHRLPLASICHRTGHVSMGLKLLSPIIHNPSRAKQRAATPAEMSEYAALLRANGSVKEALGVFRRIPDGQVPQSVLYQAFCHINLWDYEGAVPLLERYLQQDVPPYQKLIGRVNLAAALISTSQFSSANSLIAETMELARAEKAHRLLGNGYELRSQIHVASGDHASAMADLEEAHKLLLSVGAIELGYVRKWRAIIESLSSGEVGPLLAYRAEAKEKRHFESVRDSDFYLLKTKFDPALFHRLWAGTPYQSFRGRLEREFGTSPQGTYVLGSSSSPRMDLSTGELVGLVGLVGRDRRSEGLTAGGKLHQMLTAIMRDFYQPSSLGKLFSEVFPDEHFDVASSPLRLHQLMSRLRRWFKTAKLPVTIIEENGFFHIPVLPSFSFEIPTSSQEVDWYHVRLRRLEACFGAKVFGRKEACQSLSLSEDTFKKLAAWAVESGHLVREGAGPATRYRFKAEAAKRAA